MNCKDILQSEKRILAEIKGCEAIKIELQNGYVVFLECYLSNSDDLSIRLFPALLGQLSALRTLKIYECDLHPPPPDARNLQNLIQTLKIYDPGLYSPQPSSTNLQNEIHIHIANYSPPPSSANLQKLWDLHLVNCRLKEIPSWIQNLPFLRGLNLDNNEISTIPEFIGNMERLTILSLSKNKITSLPSNFHKLTNLEKLYLSENMISTIDSIESFRQLQFFHVAKNRFTRIPEGMRYLGRMVSIDFDDNQILDFPPWIAHFTHLTHLRLNNNRISSFPMTRNILMALQQCHIEGNPIKKVGGILQFLSMAHTVKFDPKLLPPLVRAFVKKNGKKMTSYYYPRQLPTEQKIKDLISIYSRPMRELLQMIIDDIPLSEYEEERVIYFVTLEERQWLENCLPVSHPVIRKMIAQHKITNNEGRILLI
jgi:Leucine-rich repeat (LRR) protein